MRMAARVDGNQQEIVAALIAFGASVKHLHQVGKGCPDLLVGFRGYNLLFECKDGGKPKSQRKLTPDQVIFFQLWQGNADIVTSAKEAIDTIMARTTEEV